MVWTPEFLAHRFTPDHPLNPVRLDLTMRLARAVGVLEGVELLEPEPASDAELERMHVTSYLQAVRVAPEEGDDPVHGHGIGLPLATEIARRSGGELWIIDPGGPGHGAVFAARLGDAVDPAPRVPKEDP